MPLRQALLRDLGIPFELRAGELRLRLDEAPEDALSERWKRRATSCRPLAVDVGLVLRPCLGPKSVTLG